MSSGNSVFEVLRNSRLECLTKQCLQGSHLGCILQEADEHLTSGKQVEVKKPIAAGEQEIAKLNSKECAIFTAIIYSGYPETEQYLDFLHTLVRSRLNPCHATTEFGVRQGFIIVSVRQVKALPKY